MIKSYDIRLTHYDVREASVIKETNAHIDAIAKPAVGKDVRGFAMLKWSMLSVAQMVKIIHHFAPDSRYSDCTLKMKANTVCLSSYHLGGSRYNLRFRLPKVLFTRLLIPCAENTRNPSYCTVERFLSFLDNEYFKIKLHALSEVVNS